jgi:biopolymer transport protein TolR
MTRKQVRVAMRRMKTENEEAEEEHGEINLVPYMDIVTNIIIFLLASVVQNVSFGNVNVVSPTIASGPGANIEEPQQQLNLTVLAGGTGFTIGAAGGMLPIIPKLPNGKYDYKALTAKLMEIKAAPENAEETKATFNADATTPYDIVIETLDAMRVDAKGKKLFPDVVFAAGII